MLASWRVAAISLLALIGACGAGGRATLRPAPPPCPPGTTAEIVRPGCTAGRWEDGTCFRYEMMLCDPKYAVQYNAAPGEIASICRRANGVPEGPVRGWDDQGRLRKKGSFTDGKPDGAWMTYTSGRPSSLTTYRQGLKQGPERTWDDSGRLRYEGEYRDNRPVRMVFFDERGQVISSTDFDSVGEGN